jgi:hypothetical protein
MEVQRRGNDWEQGKETWVVEMTEVVACMIMNKEGKRKRIHRLMISRCDTDTEAGMGLFLISVAEE